jgi:hypothetical protein
MDPKGKGMVINDKEETLYVDEPKGDKPTDSGSNNKRKDGKKKRHIKKIIYYDNDDSLLHHGTTMMKTPRRKRKRLIKTIILITLVFPTIQMHMCCLFHLKNSLTLM